MNDNVELPHRSSSPMKRRASSLEANDTLQMNGKDEFKSSNAEGDGIPANHDSQQNGMNTMSDSPHLVNGNEHSPPAPPLLEQVKVIETLLKAAADAPIVEGSVAYVVSRTWVDKALALRHGKASPAATALGPIDNSDIIQEIMEDFNHQKFTRLKPGTDLESFELFPEEAWKLVLEWYGVAEGQLPIERHAINTAESKQAPSNIIYELHPPVFRVYRLWSSNSTIPIEQSLKARNPPLLVFARSSTTHAQSFLKDLKTQCGIPLSRKVRVFSVPIEHFAVKEPRTPQAALTPPDSPDRVHESSQSGTEWPNLLLDTVTFAEARDLRVQVPLSDQTYNEKYNGNAALLHFSLTTDQILVLDEAIASYWVSTFTGREKISETRSAQVNSALLPSKYPSSRTSPVRDGPVTRSRAQKKWSGRHSGVVGLHNLGNTCYMNSALQCVRSVEELTKYFLMESHLAEINETNVLGYEGRVAIAYGSLLREIYEEGRSSVSPRDFKSTVGRCRPTFSGYGQQDSQEFLGFLLDALQEDLSRIKKKPYIEKPESSDEMINNPEAIRQMASQVWDITRRRDDSVIADLFTGMYKSTLNCPVCGKISITFDPFNNLTLPLPSENLWSKSVKFFPLNDAPVIVEVEIPKHSTFATLKQFVSVRTGVPIERMIGAEEFNERFFKIYDELHVVSEEIQAADLVTLHELESAPTNRSAAASQSGYRSMLDIDMPPNDEEAEYERCEVLVVPVLHRRQHGPNRGSEAGSSPHFITLTVSEASSLEAIERKILEKLATLSTWPKLQDAGRCNGFAESVDGEMLTTNSDAESSGDSKVADRSVQGEEDLVDVSKESARQTRLGPRPGVLKSFNTRRARFLDPHTFLDPELQNLFELHYFSSDSDGPVPTGWSSTNSFTSLPKLSDRLPKVGDGDRGSPESQGGSGSSPEDSSNEDTTPSSQTRIMDEPSEEDLMPQIKIGARSGRPHQRPGAAGRKKFKGYRTYGKKGNKRRDRQVRNSKHAQHPPVVQPQPVAAAVRDGGPLIRLHEGIVANWSDEAWATVFGQKGSSARAAKSFWDAEVLHDPAIKLSQKKRQTRVSKGITLEECLDEFERAEILSEQDMWYCPRCKEHRRASKKFDLWKTPDILIAHLKRFSSSAWRRDKIDTLVDFPIESLDLTSRVIEKEEGKLEIYDLIAVDDHYGGLGGGHYTAYAKNFVDGQWYSFNGKFCRIERLGVAAGLMGRRSASPLGGPRFARIFEEHAKEMSRSEVERGGRVGKIGVTDMASSDEDDVAGNGVKLRRSMENSPLAALNKDQSHDTRSIDMTQAWSFHGIENGDVGNHSLDTLAGDDDTVYDGSDQSQNIQTEQRGNGFVNWDSGGIVTIPATAEESTGSDEVAEIHVDANLTD